MVNLPIEKSDHAETTTMVGSITFTGSIRGAVYVECAEGAGEIIARSMLMLDEAEAVEDTAVKDALGEVANLVAGGFKARIADAVGSIDISVPTVICGQSIFPSPGLKGNVVQLSAIGGNAKLKLAIVYLQG